MSHEVLYSMLIGALSALLISAIFGIPKFIAFIEKKLTKNKEDQRKTSDESQKSDGVKKKHFNKRTIIIALCIILGIAVIASTIALISNGRTEGSEYTITFYSNKGIYFYDSRQYGEQMVIKYQDNTVYKVETFSGGYPSEPTPPKNGEYVFLGWYKNPECTDKFLFGHNVINSDINLYAKWGQKSVGYN